MAASGSTWRDTQAHEGQQVLQDCLQQYPERGNAGLQIGIPGLFAPMDTLVDNGSTAQATAHNADMPDLVGDPILSRYNIDHLNILQNPMSLDDADMVDDGEGNLDGNPGDFKLPGCPDSNDSLQSDSWSSGNGTHVAQPANIVQDNQGNIPLGSWNPQSTQYQREYFLDNDGQYKTDALSHAPSLHAAVYDNGSPSQGRFDTSGATGPWPWSPHAMHGVSHNNDHPDRRGHIWTGSGSHLSVGQQVFSPARTRTSTTSVPQNAYMFPTMQVPQLRIETQGPPEPSWADIVRKGPNKGPSRNPNLLSPQRGGRTLGSYAPSQEDGSSNMASPTASVYSSALPNPLPSVLPCPHCSMEYTGRHRKGTLNRHLRLKHDKSGLEQRGYTCGHCDHLPFRRQDARLRHFRKKHPELNMPPAVSRK